MRFAVETWAPEFGAPVGGDVLGASDADVDLTVERAIGSWAPVASPAPVAATVLFVDGVQRIDARVWVQADDGVSHQGVCASWAAGVVRCDGRATVVAAEVRRGVLCEAADVEPIATRHGTYRAYPVAALPGGDALGQALGRARGDLEGRVAVEAGADRDLLVVDGPLGDRRHIDGAVGYIKAHHVSYLPPELQPVVGGLRAGERTPLFTVGSGRFRYSWYLRLPGPATHPWWGVVRCETSGDLTAAEAVARADQVAATLGRFASQPYNDSRAPQNLHPIAGLERELKRRLGDPALLERALRRAATA
ncbi:MAG: hypothetical protein JXA83_05175 [Acidimicrobiales bacterium]|nr:hypothetical protein [Acidimicrobiales bacterium]